MRWKLVRTQIMIVIGAVLTACYSIERDEIDPGDPAAGWLSYFLLAQLFDSTASGCPVPTTSTPGDVGSFQKISATEGGFSGVLDDGDNFGHSTVALDLNGDCRLELAVGANFDDDGGTDRGAVWILFLNADGTVSSHQKISSTQGNFTGSLDDQDEFGHALGTTDLNNDGIPELLVSATKDDDGGSNRGALYVLFMNTDGTVSSHQKISNTAGGFGGALDNDDEFGFGPTHIGDLDGNGIPEIAAGGLGDDGGPNRGELWVLFMNADGTVRNQQSISDTSGNFSGTLNDNDNFGLFNAGVGDLDGDGVRDLATAAYNDDDGGADSGAVWTLFLNANGTVKNHSKISSSMNNSGMVIDAGDLLGHGLIAPGDLNQDGVVDLIAGAPADADGGTGRGATWPVFLGRDGIAGGHGKISNLTGDFNATLADNDNFGSYNAYPGDLNGDGVPDLVSGARGDDDGGTDRGAVYVLFLQGMN